MEGTLFFKKTTNEKLQNLNKDKKISHERGNSLNNKVRVGLDLDSPDPLNPLPTG